MASVLDGEAGERVGGGFDVGVDLADEVAHLAADVVKEVIHLLVGTFHDQLDPAVRKIPDIAPYVMGHCQVVNRVTKTHALDAPGEMTDPAVLATGSRTVLDVGAHRWGVV